MKKIIFLLMFIICLFPNTVKAYSNKEVSKPFVCGVGYDYSDLLEYEGYEIISKSVDFYNIGTYYITYLDVNTKETFTKRVDVIDFKNIYNDGYYRINKTSLTSPNYRVIDSYTFNDQTYILEVNKANNNESNVILTIVENKNITLSKVIKEKVEASFNKIIVDEEGIYILGTIYKEGYSIDLYLMKLDYSYNIVFESTIGGSGVDNLTDATLYGDYLFLTGNTTSSGGYFSGVRKQEDSFVMKVTKDLFNVDKVIVNTLTNINSNTDITIKDEYIYICEQYSNIDSVLCNIKVYDLDLKIVSSNSFINSHALTPSKFVSNEQGVFLVAYQYNYLLDKYSARIYSIDDKAQATLYYDYTNSEEENTHILDINFNCNQVVILTYDYKTKKAKIILKNLNDNSIAITSIDCDEPLEFIDECVFITKKHDLIDYIFIKEYDSNKMFINNEYVDLSINSKIELNKNIFGNYHNIYVYETNNLCFAYMISEYVDAQVSVINNETFDQKLKLTFNGVGYLNGSKVESGFIIESVGLYQLELYGNNNERKVYQFKINNLSDKEINLKEKTNLIKVKEESTKVNNDISLLYGESINNQSTKTYYFFLLLIPLTILVINFIILFRRKHEK